MRQRFIPIYWTRDASHTERKKKKKYQFLHVSNFFKEKNPNNMFTIAKPLYQIILPSRAAYT